MIMATLNNLITGFSVDKLKQFFRQKISTFKPDEGNYEYLFEDNENITDNYEDIIKIGEADLTNSDDLIAITAKTLAPLTNRTGKKRQFEIAKKILKEENKDAAFFIFYDDNGNFRFSLIRANFLGAKRDFTDFRRYTYFVSPELTNKTFKSQISKADFNDLDSIQEAFSVEPITKQFYEKLQHWYFWAINNVKFPDHAEREKNGREVAIIRLITRLMFIWFMKVRNLVTSNLFDEENIIEILKDLSPEKSTYYKAILQNLFFSTLNTKQKERKFRSEARGAKGYNPDFGNHHVYRYYNLFKNNDSLIKLFGNIPFLNGGLFECLDYKTKECEKRKYIDGFTDTKEHQPSIPNFLFFSDTQKVDISNFFGTSNKTYEVQGLINLLNNYNFTIDENEPDDIEIALDPELLGSVFENLLASYNPETATTARKATGSFYTPREIVNYMTTESLKQYFKTHLQDSNISNLDEKLKTLVTSGNYDNPFDEGNTKNLIRLINDLRVVDPAVGSGAFPMAILNKLVFILGKLDPENTFWQQSQIDGIRQSISDPLLQRKLIEHINRQFKEKNADYGRKLYLIEKCIYGVDIQQIAVEIAKLRFFISLLVDEKIDFDKPENNYGIEPLPNLDFKLMQGNSLISSYAGIDFNNTANKTENLLFDDNEPYRSLIKRFEELKNEYQNESDKETKDQLRDKIEKTILKIFEEKIDQHLPQFKRIEQKYATITNKQQREQAIAREKQQLTKKLGFDIEQAKKDLIAYTEGRKAKDFFLWNIYFAEVFSQKSGFDIVIGNPPYIQLQRAINGKLKFADLYKNENYETFERTGDIYALFYEKGTTILSENGLLCYITSNKWMRANYGKSLRKFFSRKNPLKLIDLGPGVFNTATVDTNILLIEKSNPQQDNLKALTLTDKEKINQLADNDFITLNKLSEDSWIILNKEEYKIKQRIESIGTPLKEWDIKISYGIRTGLNKAFIIDGKTKDELIVKDSKNAEIIKPILRGRDIKRYKAAFADLWVIIVKKSFHNEFKLNYPILYNFVAQYEIELKNRGQVHAGSHHWIEIDNSPTDKYLKEFEKEKILYQEMVQKSSFIYDDKSNYFCLDTGRIITGEHLKFLLSIFNSNLFFFAVKSFYGGGGLGSLGVRMKHTFFENLPIPKISSSAQKPFEALVDFILFAKENGLENEAETFESVIDGMVYDLYFEEEMKEANCYITDRISEVIEPFEDNETDKEKTEYIKKFYEFCRKDKTVFHGLIHRRTVKVVKIISGEK